jgi:hypothetical protein
MEKKRNEPEVPRTEEEAEKRKAERFERESLDEATGARDLIDPGFFDRARSGEAG